MNFFDDKCSTYTCGEVKAKENSMDEFASEETISEDYSIHYNNSAQSITVR